MDDFEKTINELQTGFLRLEECTEIMRDNKVVVLAAVQLDGSQIVFASDRLKKDKQIVLTSIESPVIATETVISTVFENFLNDIDFILICLYKCIERNAKNNTTKKFDRCPNCDHTNFVADLVDTYDVFGRKKGTHFINKDIFGRQLKFCSNCYYDMNKSPQEQSILWRLGLKRRVKSVVKENIKILKRNEAKLVEAKSLERLKKQEDENLQRLKKQEKTRRDELFSKYTATRLEIESMPRYQTWRNEVLQKHGRRCSVCGGTENIEVDHYPESMYKIVLRSGIMSLDDREERLVRAYEFSPLWDVNNGAPLCRKHHSMTSSSRTYHQLKKNEVIF